MEEEKIDHTFALSMGEYTVKAYIKEIDSFVYSVSVRYELTIPIDAEVFVSELEIFVPIKNESISTNVCHTVVAKEYGNSEFITIHGVNWVNILGLDFKFIVNGKDRDND